MYDLIVVGARVAGGSVALLAARSGLRVLLIDRHEFPSDTLSTNYIHQSGCARLKRWGLLEKVEASGCPPITLTRMQVDDLVIEGTVSQHHDQIIAYAPRRLVLDKILIDAACEAGAELRQKCRLQSILQDNGRVTAVTLKNADGSISEEFCHLLVGADGMRSTVAKLINSKFTREDPTLTCAYYSFWRGLDCVYELYESDKRWVGVIPTHDCTLVVTYFPQAEFDAVRKSALDAHLTAISSTAPRVFAKLSDAVQVEKLWGTGEQWNYFRQATGDNWALVGDAACHKDSLTALGITDAFTHAELLVNRIKDSITDHNHLASALRLYEADMIQHTTPGYEDTLNLGLQTNKHYRKDFVTAVMAQPQYIPMYFDAVAGLSDPQTLFDALTQSIKEDPSQTTSLKKSHHDKRIFTEIEI